MSFRNPALVRQDWLKHTLPMLVLIALTTAAIRVPLLGIPFERDEGEYAYIGWRLDYQELPYRDWVDQKPPAAFWVYKTALHLPLEPIRAVHLMALLFSAATGVTMFFLARFFTGSFYAFLAALLTVLLSADPLVQGTAANTELFMILPLTLSQLAFWIFVTRRLAQPHWDGAAVAQIALCGALTSVATAFKQVAALNGPLLVCLVAVCIARRERLRNVILFTAWFLAGAFLIWGLIALYFYAHHGLRELIENVFTHNLEYAGAMTWRDRWQNSASTLRLLSRTEVVVWFMAILGLAGLWRSGCRSLAKSNTPEPAKGAGAEKETPGSERWGPFVFTGGWVLTSLAGVAASGYFFGHYFQQLIPPLCLAAALGAKALDKGARWQAVPRWARRSFLAAGLALLPLLTLRPYLLAYTPQEAAAHVYPGNPFGQMPEFGRRLAAVTAPSDRVFIFGSEPELLFYARRASATRYIFLFPLYGPYRNARHLQMSAAEEILAHHPSAAVFMPNRLFLLPGSEHFFTEWSYSYLKGSFRPEAYLTIDSAGSVQVVDAPQGDGPALPKGHQMMASLLVRKAD